MTWHRLTRLLSGAALAEVALALVASAAGALVYQGFFATPSHLPVLGLACLTGGVTAVLSHRRAWSTALLAVAGLALVIVFGVFRGAVSAVPAGIRGSWSRLLTVAVPADPWGELLVAPVFVVWAAAFASVVLVLRARGVLAPLAPPLAGLVFALLVVGNQAGSHVVAAVVFVVAALSLIALRSHHPAADGAVRVDRQRPVPVGALLAAGLMVAASALVGVVGGQVLASGQHRFDPRDVLAPPIANTDTLTPLAQLKKQLTEEPARTLFTVRMERGASMGLDRVRTAALDVFDGTTWTSADTYRVAGSHLSVDPALTHGRQVSARVEVQELAGPHLPVLGWPSRLAARSEAGQFGFSAGSGVVVSTAPSLYGLSYELTGEVSERDDGLRDALPSTLDHAREKELPAGMPAALRAEVRRFTGIGTTPYEQLTTMEEQLSAKDYEVDRPPGHSYAAITRLLTDRENGAGYAEQHAAAFAVIARGMGYPARVAVGYRLRNYADGAYAVTSADAHAWPEVHFAGYGWVPFEPTTPDHNPRTSQPQTEAPQVVPPQPVPSTTAPAATPPGSSGSGEQGARQGFEWANVVRGTALALPVSVLLVVLGCAGIVAAKAVRRRRRRLAADPAARVLGAWQEAVDRLTERGVTPPVSLTFHEVARYADAKLGARSAEALAELATTAVYAPEHLGDTDEAWRLVDRLHTELHPRRAWAARLLAAVHPRPLWTVWRVARQRRQAREGLEMGRYR